MDIALGGGFPKGRIIEVLSRHGPDPEPSAPLFASRRLSQHSRGILSRCIMPHVFGRANLELATCMLLHAGPCVLHVCSCTQVHASESRQGVVQSTMGEEGAAGWAAHGSVVVWRISFRPYEFSKETRGD